MRSRLTRVRQLVDRYRVDRRLPPPVTRLISTTAQLRLADRRDRITARRAAVVGDPSSGTVVRLGNRRVVTARTPAVPVSELAVETAHLVDQVLERGGVECFAVRMNGDRVELGVALRDRPAALGLLADELSDGWYLQWADGAQMGLSPLAAASESRRARRARRWELFRAYRWGGRALGPETGVEITFWSPGASGEVELVGTRGHERFHPNSEAIVESVGPFSLRGLSAFPLSNTLERLDEPVDVVLTWVDGADPTWADSFRRAAAEQGRHIDEAALDPARYRSRDELRYALRSIFFYCGWVRQIWLVTAGQAPPWLDRDDDRVRLVDHAEIMPADALPTFNSHAIEASLHHIDGLAEHFVYFNDDMFVARPLRPEAFFTPNGLARVFQSGARVHGHEHDETLAVDTAALRGRELLRERFGRVVTHKPLHSPYPLRRSTLLEIDREFPDIVAATVRSRFRSPADLSIAASFGQHYGIATRASVFGEIASEYVHVESGRLALHLDRIRLADDIDTFCINETRDGIGVADREDRIRRHLDACFPVPAPWERG